MPVRIPVVAVVLVLGLTCGVVAFTVLSARPAVPSAPARPGQDVRPVAAAERYAVRVLHDWDSRRAKAWAQGDEEALSGLYAPDSSAGSADVALLRRYAARGLVVRDLRMQVLRARVLVARPGRLEVEVTDRLASATAVRTGDESIGRRLPADGPTTRHLVLRRDRGQWLMASVSRPSGSGSR